MAGEPSSDTRQQSTTMPDSDMDAEHDGDVSMSEATNGFDRTSYDADPDGSDVDAEGEEVDDEDLGGIPHQVKAPRAYISVPPDDLSQDSDAEMLESDVISDASSEASSSDTQEWGADDTAGEDTDGEDAEAEEIEDSEVEDADGEDAEAALTREGATPGAVTDNNFCIFCHQIEEEGEATAFINCAICGDNAHYHCAADSGTLKNTDVSSWCCKDCVDNGLAIPGQANLEETGTQLNPLTGTATPKRAANVPVSTASPVMALPTQAVLTAAVAASDELSPKTRPSRTRKGAKQNKFPCFIVRQATGSLVLGFSLNAKILQRILAARPKQKQKTSRARPRKKILAPPLQEQEPPHYPAIPSTFGTPLLWVERDDESKSKPYGGILADAEADNHIGKPTGEDRTLFEDTRLLAEQSWKEKVAAQTANLDKTKTPRKMSSTGSKLECVSFGGFEIDIWHAAPYPAEYSRNRILYICEFCLKYMNSDYVAWRHKLKCQATQPPGQEIYHDGTYSFFEVDGRKNPGYCQNLCLLAKLFLGSKTLYYDVEPFLFYVMTENDEQGCHFVGYFSKEKRPSSLNNVSCILVLPIYQRRGFGHMLIDFSYLLTKREQKTGSPEKPLSDMGLISYRNYWRLVLSYLLKDYRNPISINEISKKTGMTADDIVSALEGLRALVMDPHTKVYALRIDHEYMKGFIEKHEAKGYPKIDPNYLIWTPFVMHRDLAMHYEEGGQLHTVAQREDLVEDGDGIKVENGVSIDQPAFSAQPSIDSEAMAYGTPELPNGHSPQPLQTPSLLPDWTERNGRSHTGTPYPGQDIPPTRFEVFPPIPGASKRKGPGRPYGSRGRPSTGRGGRVSGINKVTPAHVNGTTPRTSSRGRAKSTPMTATRRTRNSHRESEINGTMEDVTGKSAEKSAGVDGAGDAMEE